MANILFGVTGSVAAIKTPLLYRSLLEAGHQVKIVATKSALYFFNPSEIDGSLSKRNRDLVILDEDEWPNQERGERYQRGDAVLHIDLRRWADLLLIAPLDCNTMAKLVSGICDNCLTCVWRAWDLSRPVMVAPAMNTLMWEHPMTRRQLRQLGVDFGATHIPGHLDELHLIQAINERSNLFRILPPQAKELACGDIGLGAMAELHSIVQSVDEMLERRR